MKWHIICRVGEDDDFTPEIADEEPRFLAPIDQAGNPKEIVSRVLRPLTDSTSLSVPEVAEDLVNLAAAVYSADLRVRRNLSIDRWTRAFVLYVPVRRAELWSRAQPTLRRALEFLTGDRWSLEFRERANGSSPSTLRKGPVIAAPTPDVVCLFSGGLDSFVGAIDNLERGYQVALVGHYGAGLTHKAQEALLRLAREQYKERVSSYLFYLQPPKPEGEEGEPSMRSRSFLFLSLGVAAASAYGSAVPLVVAENGFITLNVPLTYTRMGSCATRTTHPHFVSLFGEALNILGLANMIELPYRFQTKGQMLAAAKDQSLLRAGVPVTMSCAHPESGRYRRFSSETPCGYCVPCIIRGAAVSAAGFDDREHRVDLAIDPPTADTKSGRDLRAFKMAVERFRGASKAEIRSALSQVGPLPPREFGRYLQTFHEGLDEVCRFLATKG
jgi:7-cyano-7-deazaguanine synthase in queuosine biosynthesis